MSDKELRRLLFIGVIEGIIFLAATVLIGLLIILYTI